VLEADPSVIRPAAGEPGRDTGAPTRTVRTRESASAILVVLALGLVFRLILTQALPGSGFEEDLGAFRFWASNLAAEGPYGFYERDFFHDYTPGYLYVLWVVGIVGRILGDIGDLIKVPAILADIALGWLVWSMARELGAGRRAALIGGALMVANPITWFDSVVWGQVDAVGVVFLLLGLRELWRDRPERAAILTVIAAIIKPQLGILVPLVAAVTIRRALFPAGGYGDEAAPGHPGGPRLGRTTLAWERRVRGPVRILTTAGAGLLTAIVVAGGFGLSIVDLAEQVGTAAATYPYVTVNAYNPWALLELDGQGIAANGQWICDMVIPPSEDLGATSCDRAWLFGAIPAVLVGTALLLGTVIATVLAVARRPDRRTILVGLAVLAIAFFVVPTRVHERYLFPFYAVGGILAAVSIRWRVAWLALSIATLANMYVVLTTLYPGNPQISDWLGIGPALRSPAGVTLVAVAHGVGFLWVAAQLRDGALGRLGRAIRASGARVGPGADHLTAGTPDRHGTHPDGLAADGHAPQGLAAAAHAPDGPAAESRARVSAASIQASSQEEPGPTAEPPRPRYRLPSWRPRPGFGATRLRPWLRGRLLDRPIRPDRTAVLRHERGGRLDRLDLWLVVVLVLAALTLRMWRLAEPYRMHFDEVYHARTATEFLQHWRYGLSHDIYEWTHPHLAKYAMAAGLVAWGGDRVTGTSELGVSVRDALVEPRWEDATRPAARLGDRLHVVTGEELRSYDLRTRELTARQSVPGATRLALDQDGHRLFIGTDAGQLLVVDLAALDAGLPGAAEPLADLGAPARVLHVMDGGGTLLAALDDDQLVGLDATTGEELGRLELAGVAALADAGTIPALVARPAEVTDPIAAASELAALLGDPAVDLETRLAGGGDRVVIASIEASGDTRKAVDDAIAAGRLPGITVDTVPRVAAATPDGVAFVDPAEVTLNDTVRLDGGAHGLALVEGIDDPKLYVTTGPPDAPRYQVMTVGGENATADVATGQSYPLPGPGSWVRWDSATQHVHILGEPPAGRPDDQKATVYVIEPHANAVYADAVLPYRPAALVLDANELFPSADREEILAIGEGGTTSVIDAGSHALGWRIPGVLAGVLMTALLFVLARILFARRSVAVLVAVLAVVDGMFFVQSRIGMNDAYVALFIVAAYTLFAAIWTGAWRWRGAFWLAMPAIGLLLGLALSSKWVAAYAIGALGILILARSALGRVILVAGMILVTTLLGYLAMSVPADTPAAAGWQIAGFVLHGNLTFVLIMIGLTLLAAMVGVLHPIAWSTDEVRFAVGAPAAAGVGVAMLALAAGRMDRSFTVGPLAVTPLHLGFGLVVLSLVVAGVLWLAGRSGFGPLAPPPAPDDPVRLLPPPAPAPEGWLRPGWALGIPIVWTAVSLLAIPVAVYVASYAPWAWIENHRIVEGFPAGATGQTLLELTGQMYAYHNILSDGHAASSPWWAWPLNLKPVWFYQQSFAGGTSGAIYDAGNLVIWWLGIPAMAFCAWQAFRRRSPALALITVGFAVQWVSWARIDRAAFQYHYYTSLPFVVLGLAYFLAELWHGASRATWLVARLAAAGAVLGPVLLWLFHRPLCGFVRVMDANPGSQACPTLIPEFVLTARSLAVAVVVLVSVVVLVRQFLSLDRPDRAARSRSPLGEWGTLVLSALGAAVALVLAGWLFGEVPILVLRDVSVEPIALVALVPLLPVALVVASARDARRFVAGAVATIVAFFVIWYPNLSALPLPAQIVNAYQGFLPTYVYPFQFPVSTVDRNVSPPPLIAPLPAVLFAALTVTCAVIAYSAWVWRVTLAERELDEAAGQGSGGPALGRSDR